ncbi:restriction endonuclease subunit S [Fluviispira vulneris]|uniref:restriction endonuclease subunit S n=1 Tax=Fluviispira vulneris TaxID=2763012 RepID=UPI001646B974|nr:restriction endonuclease subunit S [Fluviispira vulneris]
MAFKKIKLSEAIVFNPNRALQKGKIAPFIPMEAITPFTRRPNSIYKKEYNGGAKFANGDTLVARITPCLENGKTAFISDLSNNEVGFGSTEYIVLSAKENMTLAKYIYYLAISENFRNEAIRSMTGSSGRQRIQQVALENLEIKLPDIYVQSKIINILDTLDSKIELNQKMNETLESMAKAIFKEWFIDFGPVKAKSEGKKPFGMDDETAALFPDSFEESELGLIPKGWTIKTLKGSCEILMGQSPPGSTYNENGIGMVFFQGRAEFGSRFPSPRLFCSEPSRIVKQGTVLLSVRAPVGDLNISTENQTCIGRGLAGILHKTGSTTYTYYLLQCLKEKFDMYNGEGTVFGSINKDTLSEIKSVFPPDEIIYKFLNLTLPLDQLYLSNYKEILSLKNTRDLLLPKLISGEIELNEVTVD